jgi:hypothetical protein
MLVVWFVTPYGLVRTNEGFGKILSPSTFDSAVSSKSIWRHNPEHQRLHSRDKVICDRVTFRV